LIQDHVWFYSLAGDAAIGRFADKQDNPLELGKLTVRPAGLDYLVGKGGEL
jgi:hypothetical protein